MCTTPMRLAKENIGDFCKKWGVRELSLFGSVLRNDHRPDSDIDILVDFKPGVERSLLDLVSMTDELKAIFGREVDLVTRNAVENSENYIRRKAILSSLEVVYAS
jgi:uncharacterized protein